MKNLSVPAWTACWRRRSGTFELIVIDDCSTDATWEIVQTYDDPRIQRVRTPREHGGGVDLCADGIDRFGTGEYIAVHNSDDLWMPGKLQAQVEYLDGHPECGAVFTGAQVIGGDRASRTRRKTGSTALFSGRRTRISAQWLHEFFYAGQFPVRIQRDDAAQPVRTGGSETARDFFRS